MRGPNGRGPPSPDAGNDPPIDEQPAKVLDGEFNQPPLQSQDEGAPPTAVDAASDISPIACVFGQETLFGAAMDMSDWAASHASSAATAAWRGDLQELSSHLEQAGNAIKGAVMLCDELARELEKAPAA